jgi:hypothetical protein
MTLTCIGCWWTVVVFLSDELGLVPGVVYVQWVSVDWMLNFKDSYVRRNGDLWHHHPLFFGVFCLSLKSLRLG